MGRLNTGFILAASFLTCAMANYSQADEVHIVSADFHQTQPNTWLVYVTLEHADSGWDHYADAWRVVDEQGNILGTRELLHPHVDEQPFTRELSNLKVPANTTTLYIEARDKPHGWSPNRLKVDMSHVVDGRVTARP